MPLKLNVGLSKKIGLPNYGSLGASCHLEVELEQLLLSHDQSGLHERIRQAFLTCRSAVQQELSRENAESSVLESHHSAGNQDRDGASNGHRSLELRRSDAPATQRQIRAIEVMALRQRMNLLELLAEQFDKENLSDLTREEASRLIGDLSSTDGDLVRQLPKPGS